MTSARASQQVQVSWQVLQRDLAGFVLSVVGDGGVDESRISWNAGLERLQRTSDMVDAAGSVLWICAIMKHPRLVPYLIIHALLPRLRHLAAETWIGCRSTSPSPMLAAALGSSLENVHKTLIVHTVIRHRLSSSTIKSPIMRSRDPVQLSLPSALVPCMKKRGGTNLALDMTVGPAAPL